MTHNKGELWESVNMSETFAQLSEAILKCADDYGNIQGRVHVFKADELAKKCLELRDADYKNFNLLTREFGIRQQAIYLDNYKSK